MQRSAQKEPPLQQNVSHIKSSKLKACKYCSHLFKKRTKWQKFCNSKCRNGFHNDKRILGESK